MSSTDATHKLLSERHTPHEQQLQILSRRTFPMSEVYIFTTHMRLFLSVPNGSTHEAKSAPMDYTQPEGRKKYMRIIIDAFYSRSWTHDLSDKCHGEPWVVTKAITSFVPCQCEAERPKVGSEKTNLVARRLSSRYVPPNRRSFVSESPNTIRDCNALSKTHTRPIKI